MTSRGLLRRLFAGILAVLEPRWGDLESFGTGEITSSRSTTGHVNPRTTMALEEERGSGGFPLLRNFLQAGLHMF